MNALTQVLRFLLDHPLIVDYVAAGVPLALLGALLYARRGDRERVLETLTAFTAGLVATLPVVVLALPAGPAAPGLAGAARAAFVDASLVEEAAKFVAMLWLFSRATNQGPFQLLLSGLMLGLGFATMENLLFLSRGSSGMLLRTLSTAPCHAFLGAVMASYLARYVLERRHAALAKALVLPFLLHGLYDLPLMMDTGGDPEVAASNAVLAGLVLALLATWTRFLLTTLSRVEPVEVRAVAEGQDAAGSRGLTRDGVDAA